MLAVFNLFPVPLGCGLGASKKSAMTERYSHNEPET